MRIVLNVGAEYSSRHSFDMESGVDNPRGMSNDGENIYAVYRDGSGVQADVYNVVKLPGTLDDITLTIEPSVAVDSIAIIRMAGVDRVRIHHKRGSSTRSDNYYTNTSDGWQRNMFAETNFKARYFPNLIRLDQFPGFQVGDTIELEFRDGRDTEDTDVSFGVGQIVVGNLHDIGITTAEEASIEFLDFSTASVDDEGFLDVFKRAGTFAYRFSSIIESAEANQFMQIVNVIRGGEPTLFMNDKTDAGDGLDEIDTIYGYLKDAKFRFSGNRHAMVRILAQGLV